MLLARSRGGGDEGAASVLPWLPLPQPLQPPVPLALLHRWSFLAWVTACASSRRRQATAAKASSSTAMAAEATITSAMVMLACAITSN